MTRQLCLGFTCVAALALAAPRLEARAAGMKLLINTEDAAAAAKASPELVGMLSKQIGATPEQAASAAGALFGAAKSRLKGDEFSQIAKVVPGMAALLKAAPEAGGVTGTSGALSQLAGSAAGLAGVASQFSKLGLKPELVAQAVPVLTSFVSKYGGPQVANLLGSVLK